MTKDRAIKILAGISIGLVVIGGGIAYKGYLDNNNEQQIEINLNRASKDIRAYTESIEDDNTDMAIFLGGYKKETREYLVQIFTEQPYYKVVADPYYKELYENCYNYVEIKLKEHNLRGAKPRIVLYDCNGDVVYGEAVGEVD